MGQIDSALSHDYIMPSNLESYEVLMPLIIDTNLTGDLVPESDLTRRLFFIHGLGGNAASWTVASDACWNPDLNVSGFPRNCFVSRPEYVNSVTGNLNTAAYDVREQIRRISAMDDMNYGINPGRAILFGHSQGSLVGRAILHLDGDPLGPYPYFGRGYGGYVSIAGPLGGAKILNNRNLIVDMAEDACNRLSLGPTGDLWWLQPILQIFQKKESIPNTCNLVSQTVLPMFFSDYYDNITNDYVVGAPYLDLIKEDTNYSFYKNLPKLAAYAVEPSNNILWRTANWLIHDPNDEPPFQANEDFQFYNEVIKPTYNTYLANYEEHANNVENCENLLACPLFWFTLIGPAVTYICMQEEIEKRDNWYAGVSWFNNANIQWEVIIGGRELRIDALDNGVGSLFSSPLFANDQLVQSALANVAQNLQVPRSTFTTSTATWLLHTNDGIITAESAIDLDAPTHSPVLIFGDFLEGNPPSAGSSHMQVRNDSGLNTFLQNLFDGTFGSFFKTNRIYH